MSTLVVTSLRHTSSSSNNVVLDSGGNATFAGTVVPSSSFLRNRIINGAMEIAQRATTATGAYTSVYVYASVDRWAVYSPNSSTTQAQSTDAPTGFRNSFRIQRPASNTGTGPLLLAQAIESVNCYDLSSQTVTFSFWAKRGANYSGGALSVSTITGTVADQGVGLVGSWTGRQTPISTSFAITTTWTRYTATGTFGSGVLEAAIEFSWSGSGTAGADDSVYITGVQLEAGSVATPFERRQFGQELQLCHRYFQRWDFSNNWGAPGGTALPATKFSTTDAIVASIPTNAPFRTAPTCSASISAPRVVLNSAVTTAAYGGISTNAAGNGPITVSAANNSVSAGFGWMDTMGIISASAEL